MCQTFVVEFDKGLLLLLALKLMRQTFAVEFDRGLLLLMPLTLWGQIQKLLLLDWYLFSKLVEII